jgi:hypothetical protein
VPHGADDLKMGVERYLKVENAGNQQGGIV